MRLNTVHKVNGVVGASSDSEVLVTDSLEVWLMGSSLHLVDRKYETQLLYAV
ncbi:hypothetical protein GCM10025779_06310 [Arthrobacter cryoconiti]